MEALREYGCFRLAARINDLRNEGHNIETKTVKFKNRHGESVSVAEYSLV